jgi:hypothetical protein
MPGQSQEDGQTISITAPTGPVRGAPVRNFAKRFSGCVLGGVEVAYCPSGWLVRGVSW